MRHLEHRSNNAYDTIMRRYTITLHRSRHEEATVSVLATTDDNAIDRAMEAAAATSWRETGDHTEVVDIVEEEE